MSRKTFALIGFILLAVLLGTLGYSLRDRLFHHFYEQTGTGGKPRRQETAGINIIADSLQIPWRVAAPPDGSLLATERPGVLRQLSSNGNDIRIEGVHQIGEGGLLGLVLHPRFKDNRQLYLYLTTKNGDNLVNRVERYVYHNKTLHERTTIITDISGSIYHDGGELAFGPDGHLYVGTGDASFEELSQDSSSLGGKILRVRDDGSIPDDNPFNNAVYSLGHRNVQGLAWDDKSNLWATDHGPSGVESGYDELNKIEKGGNYGWSIIRGSEEQEGLRRAVMHSGPTVTWAPSDLTYTNSSLYFTGLRGRAIYEAKLNDTRDDVTLKTYLQNQYGRLRSVLVRGSSLIVSTSNTDGRGQPFKGDDKILEFPLNTLN